MSPFFFYSLLCCRSPIISDQAHHLSQSRHDRLLALHRNWEEQLAVLTDTYLCWKHPLAAKMPDSESPGHIFIVSAVETNGAHPYVINTGSDYFILALQQVKITQQDGEYANAALICHGFLGTALIHPTVAISLDTLELYHWLRRRQPRLSIQSMARALCDLQKVSEPQPCHGASARLMTCC